MHRRLSLYPAVAAAAAAAGAAAANLATARAQWSWVQRAQAPPPEPLHLYYDLLAARRSRKPANRPAAGAAEAGALPDLASERPLTWLAQSARAPPPSHPSAVPMNPAALLAAASATCCFCCCWTPLLRAARGEQGAGNYIVPHLYRHRGYHLRKKTKNKNF